MKTVMDAKSNIAKLWGSPKYADGQDYRLMKYILKSSCDDGILIYNVVTSEMLLLDEPVDLEGDLKSLPTLLISELVQKHFLVPKDFDEKKSVDQLRIILRKLEKKKNITGFTILPTTCCNARCFYCYENNFPKQTMSLETADDVVDYILEKSCGSEITIGWFGGEPLVGKQIIDYISAKLNDSGIKFASSMISNAYLFSDSVVKNAKESWHLSSVQITLDGTEPVYNRIKAYQGVSDNPYHRVLQNIHLLLEAGISVSIRLNVCEDNLSNLYELVDELSSSFHGVKRLGVYPHIIYGDVGYDPLHYVTGAQKQLVDKTLLLEEYIEKRGFPGINTRLPVFHYINCMADNDQSIIIYPDGKLGKCENSPPSEAIGSIYDGIDTKACSQCKSYNSLDLCGSCPSYPYCLSLNTCPDKSVCTEAKQSRKIQRYESLLTAVYVNKNSETEYIESIPDYCT